MMEVWRNPGKYGEMWGEIKENEKNMGKYGGNKGN
jgi:hypothetical protein